MGAQYPQSGMGRKRVTLVDTDILIDAGRDVPEAINSLKDIKANSTLRG